MRAVTHTVTHSAPGVGGVLMSLHTVYLSILSASTKRAVRKEIENSKEAEPLNVSLCNSIHRRKGKLNDLQNIMRGKFEFSCVDVLCEEVELLLLCFSVCGERKKEMIGV